MKIVVQKDDGEEIVFQGVTDAYLAVRQYEPEVHKKTRARIDVLHTKSYSWGSGFMRDIVKEIRQSLIELQDYLNCGSSS